MPITTLLCHTLRANVTRVMDFEGHVTRLICPEYDEPTGLCRIRREGRSGGPLSQLLERMDEDTLDRTDARCPLA